MHIKVIVKKSQGQTAEGVFLAAMQIYDGCADRDMYPVVNYGEPGRLFKGWERNMPFNINLLNFKGSIWQQKPGNNFPTVSLGIF